MTVVGVQLGAPGIYPASRPGPAPLRGERLDIAGFVGVAPRGPLDDPVPVESWSAYQWRFGGLDGPGLLAPAVSAFFAQGGRRAVVLRVSPRPAGPAAGSPPAGPARAEHALTFADRSGAPQPVSVFSRDEGAWGNLLRVLCEFDDAVQFPTLLRGRMLDLPDAVQPPAGSLLRVRAASLPPAGVLAFTGPVGYREEPVGRRQAWVELDGFDTDPALSGGEDPIPVDIAVVTATVTVTDTDPGFPRQERFAGLGLSDSHPRFLPAVLATDSLLVDTDPQAYSELLPLDGFLGPIVSAPIAPGRDRYESINEASFFDDALAVVTLPVDGVDGLPEGVTVRGLDRMSLVREIGLLCAPDLFWYSVIEQTPEQPVGQARSPQFATCRPEEPPLSFPSTLRATLLDGGTQLDDILRRQLRMVGLAERQQRFVALLDVPMHLPVRAIARWRARFDSTYAAGYHPWLGVVDADDPRGQVRQVPPSGFAAGIIAERENRLGIPWGPANEIALGAVLLADPVTDADHDALHLLGIDVFRAERDGLRLTSARTLATDPDYRQLSVRRLVTMLRLMLDRQLQWLVFEPNGSLLRRELTGLVTRMLRELFRAGAFAGDTEADAFFVRCDDTVNPGWSQQLGRLVAEIGVAPAQPLEYLVLRIAQNADGGLAVEGA
jgi:uncharacterized protein